MSSPQVRAVKVAEAVANAWVGTGRSSSVDAGVPLGVVAALSLLGQHDADGPDPAQQLLAASDQEIAQVLSEVWCLFTIMRPELAFRAIWTLAQR